MRRPRRRPGWLAAAGLAWLFAEAALAGNLTVAPTRIDLAPEQGGGSVTLENNDSQPTLVQVETFAWKRTPLTSDLEPTRELVAVPPVFELAPGARQIIRVALRQPHTGPTEAAYRLVITEVPPPGGGGGVRFALRLSLPVFATPPGAAAHPQWRLQRDGAALRLEVANLGAAHLLVQRLRLSAGGRHQEFDQPTYVLAGQRHAWDLALPVAAGGPVALAAETSLGPISDTLAVQGG